MKITTRDVTYAVIAALCSLSLIGIGVIIGRQMTVPVPTRAVITEDMPGWDCRTMGNRVCGPDPSATPYDLGDPYTRCVLALDAAEVASELCDPLLRD